MAWNTEWKSPVSDPQFNPKPVNHFDTLSRDDLLVLWEQRKKVLALAKEQEMELRKYIVEKAFPNADEGINKQHLGNGYELKAVIKYNYKLKDNDVIEATLAKIEKIGNQGAFIADRLVSWTPNFILSEYRNLLEAAPASNEAQEILAAIGEMLIVDKATPILEIKEPKSNRK